MENLQYLQQRPSWPNIIPTLIILWSISSVAWWPIVFNTDPSSLKEIYFYNPNKSSQKLYFLKMFIEKLKKKEGSFPWQKLCHRLTMIIQTSSRKVIFEEKSLRKSSKRERVVYLDRNCAISISVKKPKRRPHLLQLCPREPGIRQFYVFSSFLRFLPWTRTHPQKTRTLVLFSNWSLKSFLLFLPLSLSIFVSALLTLDTICHTICRSYTLL